MHSILHGVSYAYSGMSDDAVHSVSAAFSPGWTGIVGACGSGKSTIAKLACGLLTPHVGYVDGPASLVCAYCDQQVLEPPADACDFVCDWGATAAGLRDALGIGADWPWRFDTLSAGERKRLQIACALAHEPDLLVLDEPTNFLDSATRSLVAQTLRGFRGIGLLISHDRELLDGLVQRCLFVEAGRAVMRPGTYSAARDQEQRERDTVQVQRDQAKRELARLEHEKRRRAQEADKAAGMRSKRGLDPHDHDAREKIGRYIVSGQDGRRGRFSASMDARVAAARDALEAACVAKRYEGDLWLETTPSPRKALARLEPCNIALAEDRALAIPPLALGPTDHVGIAGDNGAGKSTLVRHLLARMPDDLRVVYIPQEVDEVAAARFMRSIRELPPRALGRVLSTVAQLGSRPQTLLQGASASPGELRKLMLARGLELRPELIVMDEPTNHLDIVSVEALQRVLAACPCALVCVSHDAAFLAATTQISWQVEHGPGHGGTGRVRVL